MTCKPQSRLQFPTNWFQMAARDRTLVSRGGNWHNASHTFPSSCHRSRKRLPSSPATSRSAVSPQQDVARRVLSRLATLTASHTTDGCPCTCGTPTTSPSGGTPPASAGAIAYHARRRRLGRHTVRPASRRSLRQSQSLRRRNWLSGGIRSSCACSILSRAWIRLRSCLTLRRIWRSTMPVRIYSLRSPASQRRVRRVIECAWGCRAAAKAAVEARREFIWESLPEWFELPVWDHVTHRGDGSFDPRHEFLPCTPEEDTVVKFSARC